MKLAIEWEDKADNHYYENPSFYIDGVNDFRDSVLELLKNRQLMANTYEVGGKWVVDSEYKELIEAMENLKPKQDE